MVVESEQGELLATWDEQLLSAFWGDDSSGCSWPDSVSSQPTQ